MSGYAMYPAGVFMGISIGIGIGFLLGDSNNDISQDFRNAANSDNLTNELVCADLETRVNLINDKLLRAVVTFDKAGCLNTVDITRKPSSP